MKKRGLTILLILCLLLTTPVLQALAVETQVGVRIEKTLFTSVTAEEGPIVLLSAATQSSSGITVTAEQPDEKTLNIYYEGTPNAPGELSFVVSYTDNGVENTVTVPVTIEALPDTPTITGHSPSETQLTLKQSDSPAAFAVAATGNGTLSYEWILNSTAIGSDISCSVDPSTLEPGQYDLYCVIRNRIGSYVSGDAEVRWELTVEKGREPLEITSTASSAELFGSGTARFTVKATGEGLTYQWYALSDSTRTAIQDGNGQTVSYSGADSATLRVTCDTAPRSMTMRYVCVVTDDTGETVETDAYTLNITEDASMSKVSRIEVVAGPDRTDYTEGDTLDTTGLKISVTTPKSTELITEGFACDPMLLQKEGTQVINVSYGGKTTTFTVNVKAANHDHKWGAWEVDRNSDIVSRRCEVKDCTAREALTTDDFIVKYPELAEKMGLISEEEPETGDSSEPEDGENESDGRKKNEKKSDGSVFLIVIILAALLLAGAVTVYILLYRKPGDGNRKKKKNHLNDMHF